MEKDFIKYIYIFRSIGVPCHEVYHLKQDNKDYIKNEWEASYYSFELLKYKSNKFTEFANKNYKTFTRFLLFHESLVRNLSIHISSIEKKVIEKWLENPNKSNFNLKELCILDNSIIKAKNRQLNTYAKNIAALNNDNIYYK